MGQREEGITRRKGNPSEPGETRVAMRGAFRDEMCASAWGTHDGVAPTLDEERVAVLIDGDPGDALGDAVEHPVRLE